MSPEVQGLFRELLIQEPSDWGPIRCTAAEEKAETQIRGSASPSGLSWTRWSESPEEGLRVGPGVQELRGKLNEGPGGSKGAECTNI